MPYDILVRQTVASVIVDSKEQIRVVFKDGVTVVGRLSARKYTPPFGITVQMQGASGWGKADHL